MATWEIYDNSTTELIGFDTSWLPAHCYAYVTPRISKREQGRERVHLEAGPYVGTLPLTNQDTLYIIPRFGRQAFSRMLLLTEGLSDAIHNEFDELAHLSYEAEEAVPWTLLLARPYMLRLELVERLSLMPGREERFKRKSYAKGKIAVVRTLRSLARREEEPVHCYYRHKTYMTVENRMLATAAAVLLDLNALPSDYYKLATRWFRFLEDGWINQDELQEVLVNLQARRYVGPRSYYIPALLMARLILIHAGIALDQRAMIESETLLTNMPILFERYVRVIAARVLSEHGYLVEKQSRDLAPELFLDGTCKLVPDAVISDYRGIQLVVDTKYKTTDTVQPSDYHQMYAYLDGFDTNIGLLVFPNQGETDCTLVERKLISSKKIFELRIPLHDWATAEASVKEVLAEILDF